MAKIYTREEVGKIVGNEELTPEEKTERLFSLYGRALDDGYISKSAAAQAQAAAIEAAKAEAVKDFKAPDVKASVEYKDLENRFDAYKAKQAARASELYKDVKPKFFDEVYDRIDRAEGAKPEAEQLSQFKADYEEWFISETAPAGNQPKNTPQYSQAPGRTGTNPTSKEDELYNQLAENWK